MRVGRWSGWIAGSLCLLTAAAVTSAAEASPTPSSSNSLFSGDYAGTAVIAASGLTANVNGGSVVSNVSYDGSWDMTVDESLSATGRFRIAGPWSMEITAAGTTGSAAGNASASGTLTGQGQELVAAGTESNSFTVEFQGFSRSYDNSGPMPTAVFRVQVANCSEISGTWEKAWEGVAAEAGYSNSQVVTGEFIGVRVSYEEDKARIDEFVETWNANSAEQNANIDVSGLPSVMVEMRDLQRATIDLRAAPPSSVGSEWLALVDQAAELSERIRNADPCELGGRSAQQGVWTLPSGVVFDALEQMLASDDWLESDQMLQLAIDAVTYNVIGPNAADPGAAATATAAFERYIQRAETHPEVVAVTETGREVAVDALLVANIVGLPQPDGLVDMAATEVYTSENGDSIIIHEGTTTPADDGAVDVVVGEDGSTLTIYEGVTTPADGE